eukprot:2523386-Rhodomonas_salina.1
MECRGRERAEDEGNRKRSGLASLGEGLSLCIKRLPTQDHCPTSWHNSFLVSSFFHAKKGPPETIKTNVREGDP